VFDEYNEIEYFIAIERDITTEYELNQIKLNQLIEEQQQLCAEKSKLIEHICILAHDLKAPLTNIQSLLNISPTADKSADLLLKKEVRRSQNLIHKILSNAINESGKTDLVLTQFMPTKVLSHLTQANKIGLTARKLTTSVHCSDELRLHSDEILFTQILENLFVNAIKYACYASQINFKIWQKEEGIKLVISNKTEHLQGWQLENLFKPFQNFQVQNSQNSNGMGTYIVQKHLALIGGEISASIMDKILRFELTIPNFKGDIKTSDPTHSESLPFNSI
jgi:K+-sensing histidine kinase KdpD